MKFKPAINLFCILFLFSFTLPSNVVYGQTIHDIKGTVTDKVTNEPLGGAIISVTPGKARTGTDIEGNFTLKLQDGTYTLSISYISYVTKTFTLKVVDGKPNTTLFQLEEDNNMLEEFTVTDYKVTRSEKSVVLEMKKSGLVVNGISAELISRLPDRDAAQVVKRIPGVTVMGDKYIIVRGLPQRYNSVWLNGTNAPSFDPDSRAFSFDILPSNMIDRVMLYKTGAPELPADFAGGMVKISTTSMPDKNEVTINANLGYRPNTTFETFLAHDQGKWGWTGLDKKFNDIPEGVPDRLDYPTPTQAQSLEWTSKFKTNYFPEQKNALPDGSITINVLRKKRINDKLLLGSVSSVSYSNTYETITQRRNIGSLAEGAYRGSLQFSDVNYTNTLRLGAMQNFTMSVGEKHRFDVKLLYTNNTIYNFIKRKGKSLDYALDGVGFQPHYSFIQDFNTNKYRSIFATQIMGAHEFTEKSKLDWTIGATKSNYGDLDRKTVTSERYDDPNGLTSQPDFHVSLSPGVDVSRFSRYYFYLPEDYYTEAVNFEQRFGKKAKTALKAGLFAEQKTRSFKARQLGLSSRGGITAMDENYISTNSYDANSNLYAAYVGFDIPIALRWKVYTGVRGEHFEQNLKSADLSSTSKGASFERLTQKLFPSANITYTLTEDNLFRFAYSKTCNRPEFREIASFYFLDLEYFQTAFGNPALKNITMIDNFDFRYENYSRNGNFSAGLFLKKFKDPVEVAFDVGIANSFRYVNAYQAIDYGSEIEFRRSISDFIKTPKTFIGKQLSRCDVVVNASYIISRVKVFQNSPDSASRPLLGQSPYVINVIASYRHDSSGVQVTVAYNRLGKRIVYVGAGIAYPTIYEIPRNSLDITITKKINKRLSLEVSCQNVLNARFAHIQDVNLDDKLELYKGYDYTTNTDNVFRSYYRNPRFTAGVQLSL